MTDTIAEVFQALSDAGFQCTIIPNEATNAVAFENETVVGFALCYASSSDLIENWSQDIDRLIASQQFVLRRAGEKAWNAYAVFLSAGTWSTVDQLRFGAIEEDLVGTRKLARGGIASSEDVKAALLPLLPLRAPPRLQHVDMKHEIRQRSTELSAREVATFLSGASDMDVLQALEEEQ